MSETFTDADVRHVIEQFVEWGERAFTRGEQKGYFSGDGYAARCLRFHLAALETAAQAQPVPAPRRSSISLFCGGCGCAEVEYGRSDCVPKMLCRRCFYRKALPDDRGGGGFVYWRDFGRDAEVDFKPTPQPEMARALVTPVCPKCGSTIFTGTKDAAGQTFGSCMHCPWHGLAPNSMRIPEEG